MGLVLRGMLKSGHAEPGTAVLKGLGSTIAGVAGRVVAASGQQESPRCHVCKKLFKTPGDHESHLRDAHGYTAPQARGLAHFVKAHVLTVNVGDCPLCAVGMLKAEQGSLFGGGAPSEKRTPGCPGCAAGKGDYPIGHRVRVHTGEHKGRELVVDKHEGGKLHGISTEGSPISVSPAFVRPGEGHQVKAPGSRGGKGFRDKEGKWQYGDRPSGRVGGEPSPVRNTIEHLRKTRAARDAGHPVSHTTDPEWLVDQAVNRRAGWPDDPSHSRGSAMPVGGKYPKKAEGDSQRHIHQIARKINTPRMIVRPSELGEHRKLIEKRLPHRLTRPEDE